jgi:heme/copper-type cytochrome/quinol oxidase subunit 1
MPKQSVYFVRAALLYLGAGMTMGALLLANKGVPFAPVIWRLLAPHIEIVLIGWTAQLAMGVALWILPRLPGQHKYGNPHYGWAAFVLLNAGVLTLCLALWAGVGWLALLGRCAEFGAGLLFVRQVFPRVRALVIHSQLEKNDELSNG